MEYGKELKKIMDKKGVTLEQVANNTGLSESTVRNVVYSRSKKEKYLITIASYLGTTLEEIVAAYKKELINKRFFPKITEIVCKLLETYEIGIQLEQLQNYISFIYNKFKNEEASQKEIETFTEGLICADINSGKISKTPH